jgi:hypothetical protein
MKREDRWVSGIHRIECVFSTIYVTIGCTNRPRVERKLVDGNMESID